MKKLSPLLIISAILIVSLFLFGQSNVKGPIVDQVLVDVRMQEDVGMKDTAEGKTDVFFYGVQGDVFKALPDNVKQKLDVYKIPSGTWSININSYPHVAPYIAKTKDGEFFNPFAIQKVRYALNWLINRKYIVDEILKGDGQPMFTMATPGQPGTYKYNLIPAKLGMTATGNENKAIADINAALTEASKLPALSGRLTKGSKFWQFDGKDVTVKFLIRVDDPQGRVKEGRYIADQIEKAGIKVERLEWDRRKCINTSYNGNPADYEWHLYTEGWGAGSTRKWWDLIIAQMYAPWYGYMPGGANPDNWNYQHKEMDDLTMMLVNGQFANEQEYWDAALKAMNIALNEAMRIYICSQEQYYVANKDRFLSRMAYGLGDGLNMWSFKTADVKPGKDGKKVLRVTEFSARGALFMSAWDPIGIDGFTDVYSRALMEPMYDASSFENPYSGDSTPWRVTWDPKKVQTKTTKDKDGNLIGAIPVPETALMYNSATKKWEKVGKGVTCFSTGTYTYKFAKYHNDQVQTIADMLYSFAFAVEWANKDGDNDKYYDDSYSSQIKPGLDVYKGIVINPNGTVTSYFDYNWPMELSRVAAAGVPAFTTLAPWPIYEAMGKLVAEGGAKSGKVYSFTPSGEEIVEPDLLNETCALDVLAKIEEMKAAKYIPASISGYKTLKQAISDYDLCIKWIKAKKNLFISTGPFMLDYYDAKNNQMIMKAYRDPSYPFTQYYWKNLFVAQRTRIDKIEIPANPDKTKDSVIKINVSIIDYPKDTATPATKGNVKVTFINQSTGKEIVYTAKLLEKGVFQVVIPAKDTVNLPTGAYILVVESQLTNEAPAVETAFLVFL